MLVSLFLLNYFLFSYIVNHQVKEWIIVSYKPYNDNVLINQFFLFDVVNLLEILISHKSVFNVFTLENHNI